MYPENVSQSLAANLSLPLQDLTLSEPPETVIVPPISRGEEFELEWDRINAGISGSPVEYPLTVMTEKTEPCDSDEEDEEGTVITIALKLPTQSAKKQFKTSYKVKVGEKEGV